MRQRQRIEIGRGGLYLTSILSLSIFSRIQQIDQATTATLMKDISLTLTIEEANLILEALGNLPFARVFALIGKIQEQARQQLSDETPVSATNAAGTSSVTVKG